MQFLKNKSIELIRGNIGKNTNRQILVHKDLDTYVIGNKTNILTAEGTLTAGAMIIYILQFADGTYKLGQILETKEKSGAIKTFSKQLSMHIAASNPLALDSKLIDTAIIEKEQQLVEEELKNSGKPEEIVNKISLGKMNKFKEENALLTQAWVMEPKKKVKDILQELSIADLKIKEFYRIKIGE